MKKLCIVFFMTIIVSSLSFSSVYAEETKETEMSDTWVEVINNLDDTNHGGLYLDGDVLHIKPVENNKNIQNIIDNARTKTRSLGSNDIVIDDVAKYTYEELNSAAENVFDKSEELGIFTAGLRQRENAITVGAKDWDEEKKQAVREACEVDNIIFETLHPDTDRPTEDFTNLLEQNTSELVDDENLAETYADLPFYVGVQIDNKRDLWQGTSATLGACVTIGSTKGYLTTAHNNKAGDPIYFDNKLLGVVSDKIQQERNLDVAFIKQTSDSKFGLTNIISFFKDHDFVTGAINSSDAPPIEGAVVCYGSASGGRRFAEILDSDYHTLGEGDIQFTHMIKLSQDGEGISGDSGGPVLIREDDYTIVGIYKGLESETIGDAPIASRWDNIERAFGVELY